MDYSTLSDEALTAGLKACAEMIAKPSKELFEWAMAQHAELKAEKARRASARSPVEAARKLTEALDVLVDCWDGADATSYPFDRDLVEVQAAVIDWYHHLRGQLGPEPEGRS